MVIGRLRGFLQRVVLQRACPGLSCVVCSGAPALIADPNHFRRLLDVSQRMLLTVEQVATAITCQHRKRCLR